MKDYGKIYLKAARRIAEDKSDYSCWAIVTAGEEKFPSRIFDPSGARYTSLQEQGPLKLYTDAFNTHFPFDSFVSRVIEASNLRGTTGDARDLRVLMLCMMAAAWKDLV